MGHEEGEESSRQFWREPVSRERLFLLDLRPGVVQGSPKGSHSGQVWVYLHDGRVMIKLAIDAAVASALLPKHARRQEAARVARLSSRHTDQDGFDGLDSQALAQQSRHVLVARVVRHHLHLT